MSANGSNLFPLAYPRVPLLMCTKSNSTYFSNWWPLLTCLDKKCLSLNCLNSEPHQLWFILSDHHHRLGIKSFFLPKLSIPLLCSHWHHPSSRLGLCWNLQHWTLLSKRLSSSFSLFQYIHGTIHRTKTVRDQYFQNWFSCHSSNSEKILLRVPIVYGNYKKPINYSTWHWGYYYQ